jgi:hypothetical protein
LAPPFCRAAFFEKKKRRMDVFVLWRKARPSHTSQPRSLEIHSKTESPPGVSRRYLTVQVVYAYPPLFM